MELLPLDETQRRLRIVGQSHVGVRTSPVDRIVGSVDRTADFDRDFKPRRRFSAQRLASLDAAFSDGALPPIEAYEAGGAYFVADGHHRVALARRRKAEFIDANLVRLHTNYEIDQDVDVRRLLHTEQHRLFMEASGLGEARPDAVIEFSRPAGYPELLEVVKAHGYDLAARRGVLPDPAEVATDFYDAVYEPAVAALRSEALPEEYTFKTDADLFLCVYERRRALSGIGGEADFTAAAQDALRRGASRRFRRAFIREATRPLPRRRP